MSDPTPRSQTGTARERDDLEIEREKIGIHNEAQTTRRDRIRWGPIWAGVVSAVGAYLFLMLALVAVGVIDVTEATDDNAIATGIAALIAFFVGGVVTGASSMWQGADDGVLHGIVMWFTALVALIVIGAFGSGVALGALDATDAFDEFTTDDIEIDAGEAGEDAEEAAAMALFGLALALGAAAAGGAAGSKMWPKDDAFIERTRVKRKD